MTKTLDQWLEQIYTADLHGQATAPLADFKTALGSDNTLLTNAKIKLTSLNALIDARGEQACAFSTKYRSYLQGVLAP
jgi:hypothetical protein